MLRCELFRQKQQNIRVIFIAIYGFVAGFIAVPVFHQVLLSLLHAVQFAPFSAFDFHATHPLGVPVVFSFSFWGGVWGVIFAFTLPYFFSGKAYWINSIIISSLVLSAVAGFIVAPLKAQAIAWNWNIRIIIVVLLINGAWGLGTALLYRLLQRSKA